MWGTINKETEKTEGSVRDEEDETKDGECGEGTRIVWEEQQGVGGRLQKMQTGGETRA